MAPPALQPRLTRPCPPAPQVPCVRRALAGGASRAHSTSPQASPLGAPPPSSVPLSTRPFVLLGTHPHPVYPPRITRPARLRPQGPAVAPARLAAAPSSWVRETLARAFWGGGERRAALLRDAMGVVRSHPAQRLPPRHLPCARPSPPRALAARALPRPERAGGRSWAQVGAGGLSGRRAALRPRSPEGSARPPRRGSASRLGRGHRALLFPVRDKRSEPFPTRPSGPHWCVPAPLLPARGAGVRRWCQALACGEGTLSARLISRL